MRGAAYEIESTLHGISSHITIVQLKVPGPVGRDEVHTALALVLVEMFKAHLVMIQRKSANPYARKTEKGPRPGGAVKAPAYGSQPHLNSDC